MKVEVSIEKEYEEEEDTVELSKLPPEQLPHLQAQ